MNYPLISEYIEAIKSAEDNFGELSYLSPVLGDDGLPVMTSGNFAVVFKMKDVKRGKFYAVKCFTKEQEGRAEAYREIAKELENVSSPYILSIRYLDKELFVDTDQTAEKEFPVLLMDWVEGKPLDRYLREILDKESNLKQLLKHFYNLAEWLISQPFAHGDLKPDNILVKDDGSLVLVDYDGMYVPALKGHKARELGSPDFSHPQRTENDYDEYIDDLAILSILLSLCIVYVDTDYLSQYGADDRLLFCKDDYINIYCSKVLNYIPSVIEKTTNYKSLMEKACEFVKFHLTPGLLSPIDNLFFALSQQEKQNIEIAISLSQRMLFDDKKGIRFIDDLIDNRVLPNKQVNKQSNANSTLPPKHVVWDCIKSKNSTEWQAALLLHALITLIAYWIYYSNPETISWDRKWEYVGWGFCLGGIVWFFFFFDYFKRDGSLGNCLIACILYPITIYYVLYRCVVKFINIIKDK